MKEKKKERKKKKTRKSYKVMQAALKKDRIVILKISLKSLGNSLKLFS